MKITGGESKGRVLTSPKGMETRPTSSKVRESIFNILGQDMNGVNVLDLFAGTGVLGIETLSRGAERAVFIDNSDQSVSVILKNLRLCGYQDVGRVIKGDATRPIEALIIRDGFHLVFVDPPYDKEIIPPVLQILSGPGVLSPHGVVVVESSKKDQLPDRTGDLILTDTRVYGHTKISIYEKGNKA
jgi:16S rRNA (guanine966-N2)-methyltransferase